MLGEDVLFDIDATLDSLIKNAEVLNEVSLKDLSEECILTISCILTVLKSIGIEIVSDNTQSSLSIFSIILCLNKLYLALSYIFSN